MAGHFGPARDTFWGCTRRQLSGLRGLVDLNLAMKRSCILRWSLTAAAAVFLYLSTAWPAAAKYASIIMDAETGRIYHEVNADTRNYPASLTKMMTLYMLFDQIDQGDMSLKTKMRVSARASRQPRSKMWLAPGSTITAETAILALVVRSANDVAVVVAEHIGKTERSFARMMTKKAKELGMTRTNFRNASGLPNRAQLSTARDMAILSQRLMNDFPQFYSYFGRSRFTFQGKTIRGHNDFMKRYAGADGLKTGYISASGYNLAASAKRDNHRLIGVVFGGKSARQRDWHLSSLMDQGFLDAAEYGLPPYPARKPLMIARANGQLVPAQVTVKPRAKPDLALLRSEAWGVQIGAFSISYVAQQKANEATALIRQTFAGAFSRIEPVVVSGKELYRAQIMGLKEAETRAACRIMERPPHECLVVTPEVVQLAQRNQD